MNENLSWVDTLLELKEEAEKSKKTNKGVLKENE